MTEIGGPRAEVFRSFHETALVEKTAVNPRLFKDMFDYAESGSSLKLELELREKHLKPLLEELGSKSWYSLTKELKARIATTQTQLNKFSEAADKITLLPGGDKLTEKHLTALADLAVKDPTGFKKVTDFLEQATQTNLRACRSVLRESCPQVLTILETHYMARNKAAGKIQRAYRSSKLVPEAPVPTESYQALLSKVDSAKGPAKTAAIRARQAYEKTEKGKADVAQARIAAIDLGAKVRTKTLSVKQVEAGLKARLGNLQIEELIGNDKYGKPLFKSRPITAKESTALVRVMAREALEKFSNEKAFEGHGKRIYVSMEEYKFHNPITHRTETVTSPYDFWVKKTEKGIEFELVDRRLGKGAFNTVYKTLKFEIPLVDETHAPEAMSSKTAVLRQAKNETSKEKKNTEGMLAAHKLVRDAFPDVQIRDALGFDLPENTDRTTRSGTVLEASGKEVFKADYSNWSSAATEPQKLEVLGSMAKALNALHEKKLVHGDFKPANVFIDKNERAHLGDFDMVCRAESKKFSGTLLYMDALALNRRKTEISDIYAMAVTVCETTLPGTLAYELAKQVIVANYQIVQSMFKGGRGKGVRKLILETLDELGMLPPDIIEVPNADKMSVEDIHKTFPAYKNLMTELEKLAPKS